MDATSARLTIVNRKINPLLEDLPEWVEGYRPHQVRAIDRIMDAFSRVDVVTLDAPTGSGKTLIGETVRRLMQVKGRYICSSKGLQDQFLRDYPYAKVLKGRGNYPTELYARAWHPNNFAGHISAEDCTWTIESPCKYCRQKSSCPYEVAKVGALRASIAVLNTSYFLTEANGPGKFSGAPLVIADEADSLEGALMGYVSFEIQERRLKALRWQPPEKVTVESSWAEWLDEHIKKVNAILRTFPDEIDDIRQAREARYFANLHDKMVGVRLGLDTGAWVYTGRGKKDEPGKGVSFKPARVDMLGEHNLWRHGIKWLLMSATIISPNEMLDSLGCQRPYESVAVENTFPVENRRVYFRDVVPMSRKNQDTAWPMMADAVRMIVRDNPDDRILVHTVSYAMTLYLLRNVEVEGRELIGYTMAGEKEAALERYKKSKNAVLFAPSMDRGVDLPGDLCRVQVIVKVPFPFLGDRQVNKRMYSRGGQVWYNVQAIRTIVQMCGRAVRSDSDWAKTYILDTNFRNNLWNKGRTMFPPWFRESIVWR